MKKGDRLSKPPKYMTICKLEVLVMPQGEILCAGKSLGWVSEFKKFLTVEHAVEHERELAK